MKLLIIIGPKMCDLPMYVKSHHLRINMYIVVRDQPFKKAESLAFCEKSDFSTDMST